MTARARYRGALLGLAAGDALGTTIEFETPGTFPPLTGIVGGGPFDLEPGQWTDDTSLALCLAESLIECDGFDAADQMKRYLRWWREGHLSSTGFCFDIGITTEAALRSFESNGDPWAGSSDKRAAGNGSLMRLAPAPLFYASNLDEAIKHSADSSRTTHAAETCVDACRYYGAMIAAAATGATKEEVLDDRFWALGTLHQEVEKVAQGSYKHLQPPDIQGTGYVVRSLEAALWALYHSKDFCEGALLAVNLGDDADTTGAVYGQLAGALYGEEGIPLEWRKKLAMREHIELYADLLCDLAVSGAPADRDGVIPDSYWVRPRRLLAGEYPGSSQEDSAREKLSLFAKAGVTLLIDLTEPGEYGLLPYEQLLAEGVRTVRKQVRDNDCPTVGEMGEILDLIDDMLEQGEVVYVHCWGGVGRTGTVVACHLVRHGLTAEAAIRTIARWRKATPDGYRQSPEMEIQRQFVRDWAEGRPSSAAGAPF